MINTDIDRDGLRIFAQALRGYLPPSIKDFAATTGLMGLASQAATKIEKGKRHKFFRKLVRDLVYAANVLEQVPSGPDRARAANGLASSIIDGVLKKDVEDAKAITCRKGCSSCCHVLVSVTSDEAKLLAELVRGGVTVDMDKMRRQSAINDRDSDAWFALPWSESACVFLGDTGACRIYDNRPTPCRTHFSVSPKERCDPLPGGIAQGHMKFVINNAEVVASAALQVGGKLGTLPSMLLEELENGVS